MDDQEIYELSKTILNVIKELQYDSNDEWVALARVGPSLSYAGVQYKKYGYQKLAPFLKQFNNVLDFKVNPGGNDKTNVWYVKPKICGDNLNLESLKNVPSANRIDSNSRGEKYPSKDTWLYNWAFIHKDKLKQLSELALEEKWYYGDGVTQEQENLPILRSYLAYTFKRLVFEKKILIESLPERNGEYAAFNTGLVDKKYEYIYALFTKNNYPRPYWYLLDFVVAGEDKGKTLVKVFNPLPQRANYFENKIQNMLYDTSTGRLSCDFIHIITERTDRLPMAFLKENCGDDFLSVDGCSIEDACKDDESKKKDYYHSLGKKIKDDPKILNRLKNRIDDAVKLALKRVEWNYKTAIPMYYPTKNTGSLLLPLSLGGDDHVDLALVVERLDSGAYQGQTILPLNLAYSNSRLVTRPDSDWLKTDIINAADSEEDDE